MLQRGGPGYHMTPAHRSLVLALGFSALLHGALLLDWLGMFTTPRPPPQTPPRMTATLIPADPPPPQPELRLDETELLPPEPAPKPPKPPPQKPQKPPQLPKLPEPKPKQEKNSVPGTLPPPAAREAQKQLARMARKEGFYPLEAINKGWQGEILVQIFLDANGHVIAARVENSSGYPILDEAALKAARALKSLPTEGVEDAFLTVSFRLE